MPTYRDMLAQSALFSVYDRLAEFEHVSPADIAVLKAIVLEVAETIGPHLDRIRETFIQYTEHDLRHLLNIADHIAGFLPKHSEPRLAGAFQLNAIELTYLWLAILLHDVGMFVSDVHEKQSLLDSPEYATFLQCTRDRQEAARKAEEAGLVVKAQAIRDALLAEFIRRRHAERVHGYIEKHLKDKLCFRGANLEGDVGRLCESHGWGVRESNDPRQQKNCVKELGTSKLIGATRVNLSYLGCCLRLGDILDFDRTRTPLSAFHEIHFTEDQSVQEWQKHLSIEGVLVTEHLVRYDAKCKHPADFVAVHQFLNWVDREIQECTRLVREFPAEDAERYQLNLSPVVDRLQIRMENPNYVAGAFRFQLEYDQIMRLLMDQSLYPDSALFLRELLQNALDACRYQKALAEEARMGDKYVPRIQVEDYSGLPRNPAKPEEGPRIIFRDNGIGMSQRQVENFFMRVGKSFYRSPEFHAEQERLQAKGIHLDACSQFGIGFLSCFLGGDRIEVETYRNGSDPLRITIEGPSKYFVIERLSRPDNEVRFNSPEDPLADSPPHHSGTKIIVHLRDGWHASDGKEEDDLVFNTLNSFAVNQEFDISVTRGNQRRELKARRWNTEAPVFCGWHNQARALSPEHLAPSVFALEAFVPQLRGTGTIWFLSENGEPVLRKGDLEVVKTYSGLAIDTNPYIRVVRELFRAFAGCDQKQSKRVRIALEQLSSDIDTAMHALDAELQERKVGTNNFRREVDLKMLGWRSQADIDWLAGGASLLPQLIASKSKVSWTQNQNEVAALIASDRPRLLAAWRKHGIRQNGEADFTPRYLFALFGIEAPGGFQTWLPAQGTAQRHEWLPGGLSLCVDAYGSLAPQPAASRLFVPYERSCTIRDSVTRAFLLHADSLRKSPSDSADWQRWFRNFLSCWNDKALAGACENADHVFRMIQDSITVRFQQDGVVHSVTPRELCERAETEVLLEVYALKENNQVVETWWLPGHAERWKSNSYGKGKIDLTPLRKKLGL